MHLVSFERDGRPGWGRLVDDEIVDLGATARSLRHFLETSPDLERADGPVVPTAAVKLSPPVVADRIFCIGQNYHAHRDEMGAGSTDYPTIFTRGAASVVGADQPLRHPGISDRFDYEGELAIIMGPDGVAGYSCFLDGSVRDFQRHTTQFTPGKNFDRSGAFGPALVTADEFRVDGDLMPEPLVLRTLLNGELVQETTTDLMIFSIRQIVDYVSSFTALGPGDVIATGTPGGVGDKRTPPLYMAPGDTVRVEIDRVGVLENLVEARQVP